MKEISACSVVEKTESEKEFDRKEVLRTHRAYWFGRRLQDIIFSFLALVVLSPLMLITALIIFIDDPHGSPIYKQLRCGRDGKLFHMYKFRSMYMDADERLEELKNQNEMDGPAFKMSNDPRVTKVGRLIRRTCIDELPQLWNILKGDMSIVGPRPALPKEVDMYKEYWKQRMYITPGLTCYWQIVPNRNEVTFDDWMALDMKYIEERSFWVDWKIIIMTIRVVLFG